MTHIHPTHRLTATRSAPIECSSDSGCPDDTTCGPDGYCVDVNESRIIDQQQSIARVDGVYVRFMPEGETVSRTGRGPQEDRSPTARGDRDLFNMVEEGDLVSLESIVTDNEDYTELEVESVEAVRGARRADIQGTLVKTEQI